MFARNPDDPARGLPLKRLADVVRDYMAEYQVPLQVAVSQVHERLTCMPGLQLYLDRPGDWADPITSQKLWRDGKPGRAGYFEPLKRPAYVHLSAPITVTVGPSRWIPPDPAVEELRGIPGALALLLDRWGQAHDAAVALEGDELAGLAMLASDAAALLGHDAEGEPRPVQASGRDDALLLLQVWPSASAAIPPAGPTTAAKPPPSLWKDERGCWTDAAKDAMRAARRSGQTDRQIADTFGTTRTTIIRLIGARKDTRDDEARQLRSNG
jgi:hypothetical protein